MKSEELLVKIKENKELYSELKKLWNDSTTAEQFSEVMTKYGVETTTEQLEKILMALQKIEANEIVLQNIDESQLENVAGGGAGVDCSSENDCDFNFIDNYDLKKEDRCYVKQICDEFMNL